MSKYLTPAQQELRAALIEANEVSQRSDGNAKLNEARLSFLLAKIKTLTAGGPATGNETNEFFRALFMGKETRAMQEGSQTLSYTQGAEGGYLVPQEFNDSVVYGMAQFDPLLNKDAVTLIESDSFALPPFTIPGWDLSTFAAVKIAEGAQQNGQTPPTVSGVILNAYKYKASLPVTMELEEDAFQPMLRLITDAYGIGFARGIGIDLAVGNGTTAPQGALTGAASSGVTSASGTALTLNDFENVYFSVNRFYRASPKCAWLMSDATYQLARKAIDTVGNPLLKLIHDKETIMGKPVLVSPSLPAYNPSLGTQAEGSFCVFGDLSHYFVRVSKMIVKRQWQLPGYVENGMALYTGIMRADAKVFDPTSGSVPPIVSARL
jgi:HK97 family phage major capsid protein